jgi:hypothetical protein
VRAPPGSDRRLRRFDAERAVHAAAMDRTRLDAGARREKRRLAAARAGSSASVLPAWRAAIASASVPITRRRMRRIAWDPRVRSPRAIAARRGRGARGPRVAAIESRSAAACAPCGGRRRRGGAPAVLARWCADETDRSVERRCAGATPQHGARSSSVGSASAALARAAATALAIAALPRRIAHAAGCPAGIRSAGPRCA